MPMINALASCFLRNKIREWQQRPEVKQQRKDYNQRPEVKQYRKEYMKEYNKEYQATHKEELKVKQHERYIKNLEQIKSKQKKYNQNHKKQHNEASRKSYKKHKNRERKAVQRWRKNNPDVVRKYKAERRGLERNCYYMNEYFDGSHGHHIDFETIIYLPNELHNSIKHCLKTGRGMAEINDKALEWLIEHVDSIAKFISDGN